MSFDDELVEHYGGGELLSSIEAGLVALGLTPATATVDVLATTDEFHVGGRQATTDLCDRLDVDVGSSVLDVGCGIGGTARLLASTFGCSVTGVDLSHVYVEAARVLTEWTDLGDRVRFDVGSALEMPFDDNGFDRAVQLHVGMNIADKQQLCDDVYRVLRPGGRFGLYDIMRIAPGTLPFPVPWATNESMSFVDDFPTYRRSLESAGFEIEHVRDRAGFAREVLATRRPPVGERNAPPLGLHIILGRDAASKIANMARAIDAGLVAPVEIICRKPA